MINREGLKSGVSGISIATVAIRLLSLHTLVDHIECVDVSRYIAQKCKQAIHEQVATAACHESNGGRREENSDKNKQNI